MNPALRSVSIGSIIFLAGASVGWWLNRGSSATPGGSAVAPSPASSSGGRSAPAPDVVSRPGDRLVSALSALDPAARATELERLARDLARQDAAAAWQLHRSISSVHDRESYCLAVLNEWSKLDGAAALAAAGALPPGRLRTACTSAALGTMAGAGPEAALAHASERLEGAARAEAVRSIVETWAGQDGPAAVSWAMTHLSEPSATGAFRAAVQTWTDTDPAAASQWVAGLPPESVLTAQAAEALVSRWAEQSPAEAAQWLSAQGVSSALDAPAASLAAEWAATDPKAAAEWAITLPRTMTARDAAARAVGEWAAVAPREAAQWLADTAPGLPALAPALHDSLGTGWAAQDPAAATAWMETLVDPFIRADTAEVVFNTWAALDTAGLADWVRTHPHSSVADEGRAQLALSHADSAPEEALAFALGISVPADATDLGRQILDDWRAHDLPSADQWRAAHPEAADFIEPLQ